MNVAPLLKDILRASRTTSPTTCAIGLAAPVPREKADAQRAAERRFGTPGRRPVLGPAGCRFGANVRTRRARAPSRVPLMRRMARPRSGPLALQPTKRLIASDRNTVVRFGPGPLDRSNGGGWWLCHWLLGGILGRDAEGRSCRWGVRAGSRMGRVRSRRQRRATSAADGSGSPRVDGADCAVAQRDELLCFFRRRGVLFDPV
jgi:hypothetical protein